ncbi:MAG: helix-turn-helix transcriptional regulator [Acidobacteriaceae bacterium]|jgi:transcriptional regulator with XRE-family HTH domain
MKKNRLFEKLREPSYRAQFVAAQVRHTIAAQIKSLREDPQRKWTQAQLGERAGGMKQNAIARLENPRYGDYTVKTLLRIARAFDIGLVVRFARFGELVDWNQTVSLSSYVPVSFENEYKSLTQPVLGEAVFRFTPESLYSLWFEELGSCTPAIQALRQNPAAEAYSVPVELLIETPEEAYANK